MNLDENGTQDVLSVFAKNQSLLGSSVLAKVALPIEEVLQIESNTGALEQEFTYTAEAFIELKLEPRGKVWLRINPVDEERVIREEQSSSAPWRFFLFRSSKSDIFSALEWKKHQGSPYLKGARK